MLIGGHPEEVSLRPSANSMMFKQTNINLNLPLNNGKCFSSLRVVIPVRNYSDVDRILN